MVNLNSLEYLSGLNTSLQNYGCKSSSEKQIIRNDLQKIENVDINFKLIQQIKLNLVLIQIAKSKDESIYEECLIKLSRVILTKWKQLQIRNKVKREDISEKRQEEITDDVVSKKVKVDSQQQQNQMQDNKSIKKQSQSMNEQLEPIRQACVNQLNKILSKDQKQSEQLNSQINEVVQFIESGLYNKHRQKVSQEYRQDCRLLWSTLNKDDNRELRSKIVNRHIDLQLIIECDKKVLIDSKTQQQIEDLKKANLDARRSDWLQEQFRQNAGKGGGARCVRCKSTNTLTNAVQTRGADEPMTEFNTCFNCSKTWKS